MKSLRYVVWAGACLALGALQPSGAAAEPVRYELDSPEALTADGFTLEEFEPSASFGGGQLHITTSMGFSEFILQSSSEQPAARSWLVPGSSARGWRIETRMQLLRRDCIGPDGPGLWVDDGTTSFRLHFLVDSVAFDATPDNAVVMDTTDAMHVYRLESPSARRVRLFVDGVMKLEVMLPPGASRALMFGDLGGCTATDSLWDYVEYDSFGEGSAGDQDSDGVADADDDCVLVANPDLRDGDGDSIGDACDACPMDADNDVDHDGTCAEDDVCPNDFRNDADGDGVCDTLQCMAFQPGSAPPGGFGDKCPAICTCPFFGIDPVNLDNFGPPNGAGGATGSAGSGGATGAGGSKSTSVGARPAPEGGAGGVSGGTGATGGTTGAAGASGASATSGTGAQSDGGGGCTLVRGGSRASGSIAALFAVVVLLGVRRRRTPRPLLLR